MRVGFELQLLLTLLRHKPNICELRETCGLELVLFYGANSLHSFEIIGRLFRIGVYLFFPKVSKITYFNLVSRLKLLKTVHTFDLDTDDAR